jgi:hypothetical protein
MSEESNQLTETNVTINTSVDSVPAKRKRSPSLKRAATKTQKESTRGFPLPLLLTCPITGKNNKYTSLTYIRKLLAKHGTVEDLRKNYISVEGRKLQANKQ